MNAEQFRDETVFAQQACQHDPQPLRDYVHIFQCPKCLKIFGKNEANQIIEKRLTENKSDL